MGAGGFVWLDFSLKSFVGAVLDLFSDGFFCWGTVTGIKLDTVVVWRVV